MATAGSAVVPGARPPLTVLGDRVVDYVPIAVTQWAITTFGSSNKAVLAATVLVGAVVACAAVGRASVRHPVAARFAVGGLVFTVALAATRDPRATFVGTLSTLLPAAAFGLVVLEVLSAGLRAAPQHRSAESAGPTRRVVLTAVPLLALSAAGLAGVQRAVAAPSAALRAALRRPLPPPARALPPLPTGQPVGAVSLLTRTSEFYRVDTALQPPQVDPRQWRLDVTSGPSNTRSYAYSELLAMPAEETDITIGCVSNQVGGELMGTARWHGVLLRDLLPAAVLAAPSGRVVRARSVDGFVASFPLHYAIDGRKSMLALGMNGAILPLEHGFPARLVVPGLYGYTSAVKWLENIEILDGPSLPGFWADRGWTPAVPVHVSSRIDTPVSGSSVSKGVVQVTGVAWAPPTGVGSVMVRVDDGPERRAALGPDLGGRSWRQFSFDWDASPGRHVVSVRAEALDGSKQDSRRRPPYPSGATGLHVVDVRVV